MSHIYDFVLKLGVSLLVWLGMLIVLMLTLMLMVVVRFPILESTKNCFL